ncbi:MAG: iron-containing alcohol dehydrogenase [Anaerolineales bacterium]|nr:iron-containing alcohol dehydrogenase [Anaerolineales bacterium]
MDKFNFSVPPRIKYGPGITAKLGSEVASLLKGTKPKVMIVTDSGVVRAGLLDGIKKSLADSGIEHFVFDEIEPNPRDTTVYKGAEKFKNQKANILVAMGGGSVMDGAKSIGVIVTCGGTVDQYDGLNLVPGPITPLIAVPTTAGTGSEVTMFSIITNTKTHYKMGVADRKIIPAVALVDPEMTYSLPRNMTIGTGLAALTHAIEAYTCNRANPVSDALALKAIRLIFEYLPGAAKNGKDAAARNGMMLGSLIAGLAFGNADVTGVHCLSESIGGLYDAPHGMVNGILLPYVMAYNLAGTPKRFADIAAVVGKEAVPAAAVDAVVELEKSLAIPALADYGVKEADFAKLASMSTAHPCTASNPRPMKDGDYVILLEASLARKPPRSVS